MLKQVQHSPGISPRSKTSCARGMTLIELLIAMVMLAVGMLGSMGLIVAGMKTNSRNRNDTTAVVLDQEVIEQFATLKTYPQSGFVNIYDCSPGGGTFYQASLIQGPSPSGAGATLNAAGNIDWTLAAPAFATSAVAGYAMQYRTCNGDQYEVRWNVMDIHANSRLSMLTVSSRQVAAQAAQNAGRNNAVLYAQPTTLRTLIEKWQ
jgi:prepilin-type N-terminal cleavage/methylation domain-containing protein